MDDNNPTSSPPPPNSPSMMPALSSPPSPTTSSTPSSNLPSYATPPSSYPSRNLSYWFVLSASAFCVAGAGTTTLRSYYSIACGPLRLGELGKVDNLIAFLWLEISLIVEFFYWATHIEGVGARAGWCGDLSLWTPTSFMAVFSGFHCTASSLQVLCLPGRSCCPAWDSLGVDVVVLRRSGSWPSLSNGWSTFRKLHGLKDGYKFILAAERRWIFHAIILDENDREMVFNWTGPNLQWRELHPPPRKHIPTFIAYIEPIRFALSPRLSNKMGLEAAVEAAATFLDKAVKPVMVGGPKLRVAKAYDASVELADDSGYAVPVMPSAKGMFPEHRPHFIQTYYGAVGTAYAEDAVTKYGCDC
ncbi:hypothetical protein RHSIM_Rhsim02G0073300 [Rhododendron simsii]|uniref:Thiamine pyrophosphate enzyme central domain-containing protein n=1 Tax=Rhododendron simsii TaxID=118357 RepID=A0A834LTS3_RHOSS|nr:hypothetical protein RHSIM_Rhsim02G0073300 [Rhododendron simsii]